MDELRSLLSTNQRNRLAKEKAAQDRIDDPKLPRHTLYQGDRKIQQLGDGIIENGIVLNNHAIAIGDPVLPLAKGNVLRRVDNTNGGALLGTAYRNAVENDVDANGNRRTLILSRNGGNEPSDPLNPNPVNPSTHPIFPPPFGCTPPPSKCFWTTNPMPPDGFQNYGSAVVNENAVPLYLHCIIGTAVPRNLNCSFLDPQKWSCSAGVCSPNPNGIYNTQAQCEAALIPPPFTGGQCAKTYYFKIQVTTNAGTFYDAGSGEGSPLNLSPISDAAARAGTPIMGPLNNISLVPVNAWYGLESVELWRSGAYAGYYWQSNGVGQTFQSASVTWVEPVSGADDCGNLPSTCP
ncbi:MAG: hypothetical protein ACK5QB_16395 [Pseudanabaena sp.]|jgi:hypothetical protein